MPNPGYVVDDETAIKVGDGRSTPCPEVSGSCSTPHRADGLAPALMAPGTEMVPGRWDGRRQLGRSARGVEKHFQNDLAIVSVDHLHPSGDNSPWRPLDVRHQFG